MVCDILLAISIIIISSFEAGLSNSNNFRIIVALSIAHSAFNEAAEKLLGIRYFLIRVISIEACILLRYFGNRIVIGSNRWSRWIVTDGIHSLHGMLTIFIEDSIQIYQRISISIIGSVRMMELMSRKRILLG